LLYTFASFFFVFSFAFCCLLLFLIFSFSTTDAAAAVAAGVADVAVLLSRPVSGSLLWGLLCLPATSAR